MRSVILLAAFVGLAASAPPSADTLTLSETRPFVPGLAPVRLHVTGNRLLNARGEAVRLRGVNIASLEWSNQGEHMSEAFDHALQSWKANLIRMPLAQDRWFGKVAGEQDGGRQYRAMVDKLVEATAAAGAYVDLDLHWSDSGKWANEGAKLAQHPMPDAHSVLFWRDVAVRYRNHPNVIFGLYNEPHDISAAVWRNGGSVTEKPSRKETNQPPVVFEATGMQTLYDTVRGVGAENVVTVSGNDWGYDLRCVLQGHAIAGTNILYETHPYPWKKDWDKSFGEVSERYAVFMGEWGGSAKDLEYAKRLMDYSREHGLHWTAWCFHPSCGPPLLKNWSFEPNAFGEFVQSALANPAEAQ
jgi:hypothetical protein